MVFIILYKIENNEFKASYKDKDGYLIRFGPYPNKKAMETSIKEYMSNTGDSYKIKRE